MAGWMDGWMDRIFHFRTAFYQIKIYEVFKVVLHKYITDGEVQFITIWNLH